jgi:short-subunit dehydrogenase
MRPLADQVVIVTGASSGIGEAIARRLNLSRARLVINARRAEILEALARELDPAGTRVLAIPGDITDAVVRQSLVDEAVTKFGGIDGLVNNAGYGTRGPVELVPVELIRRNFETNLFSLIALTQLVVPQLRKRGAGRIVNIGSVAGRIARPLSSVYDSTKHALEAITDGLRGELAPSGIQVVLIRPGFIVSGFLDASNQASESILSSGGIYAPYFDSFRHDHQRLRRIAGRPDDIAKLVEKALAARHPAPRYAGPAHAKFFLFLRWLLPARTIDWSVRLKKR